MPALKKIAVVGSGPCAQNLVRVCHELGVLGAICDNDLGAPARLGASCPDVTLTDDFAQLLADPRVAAVMIALPAARHHEPARRALLAGKDVYVAEPLALPLADARALVTLARDQGCILMVGHLMQHHAAFVQLKQLASTGALGRLRYIYSNRLSFGTVGRDEGALRGFAPDDLSMILSLSNEAPDEVSVVGGGCLPDEAIADVTTTHLTFPSGIRAHLFVSWLHPFEERRLVVVAETKLAVFDDRQPWERKLLLVSPSVEWQTGAPIPAHAEAEPVALTPAEPLASAVRHFLDCIASRRAPLTDGEEGVRVLAVLDRARRSLEGAAGRRNGGAAARTAPGAEASAAGAPPAFFAHESAYVDEGAVVGERTKIWHFCHVHASARIGRGCVLGQNVNVAGDVIIGDQVKIQNNVSVYTGTVIEDEVFLGPSCVLTNVTNPRAQIDRHALYERTRLRRGATVGANATIVCGVTIGRYAFVGAGAVVTKNVPDYALVLGNPARFAGFMSRHGHRLAPTKGGGPMVCPESGLRYEERAPGELRCLDLDEEAPLPPALRTGTRAYDDWKADRTEEAVASGEGGEA